MSNDDVTPGTGQPGQPGGEPTPQPPVTPPPPPTYGTPPPAAPPYGAPPPAAPPYGAPPPAAPPYGAPPPAAPPYGAPPPVAPGYGAGGYGAPGYQAAPGYGPQQPRSIGFVEAIQRALNGYVDFSGRATRSEYWWWFLATFIVAFVLDIIFTAIKVPALVFLVFLALFLPSLAVGIRRFHDQDKSGWFILLGLIPFVGSLILIILFCIPSTPGPNKYGPLTT